MRTGSGVLLSLLFFWVNSLAQEVPLGGWQTHFNYSSGQHIEQVENRFFCATYHGLFSYTPQQDSIVFFSKINGLHDTGISSMAYDPGRNLLLLSYRSGTIDLVQFKEAAQVPQIQEWPLLRESATLPVDRRSYQVVFWKELAYLSTTFGVVVLDVDKREVRETYTKIGKNGAEVAVYGVTFSEDSIYAATSEGILRSSLAENVNRQFYGNWRAVPSPTVPRSIAVFQGTLYAGFAGQGIFRRTNGTWQVVYPSTSPRYTFRLDNDRLVATLNSRVVTLSARDQATAFRDPLLSAPQEALLDAANNLWAADAQAGLVSNYQGTYRTYSPPSGDTTIAARTDSLVVDLSGRQWIRLPDRTGGGILVKDPATQQQRYLSTSSNNGGLPSSKVNSLSLDRDGLVWFAADGGVGYFVPDDVLSGKAINAVLPLIAQRRLLQDEQNTALVTEPGNRKWVGTRNGVYLFNADGTRLIRHFTANNSPLPSNHILALQFDADAGRLYVATPGGMVSYRSDASAPAASLQKVTVFPNPVRPGYAGVVGIKGLADQTIVKITDLTGRLVFETRSQGGTAQWDLRDYTGRRAKGGIYLVLLITSNGAEYLAGKLALVE